MNSKLGWAVHCAVLLSAPGAVIANDDGRGDDGSEHIAMLVPRRAGRLAPMPRDGELEARGARIDLAFPLDRSNDIDGMQLSIETKKSF